MLCAALSLLLVAGGCTKDEAGESPSPVTIAPTSVVSPSTPESTSVGPSSAPPSTTASAPSSASPSMLVTARPTTAAEREALAREAEGVYRAFHKLRLSYEAKGGIEGPLPSDLQKFVSGKAAESSLQLLHEAHARGQRLEKTELLQMRQVSTFLNDLEPGALIGVQFCNDYSRVLVVGTDGKRRQGTVTLNWSEFGRDSRGDLKILYNESKQVKSCA